MLTIPGFLITLYACNVVAWGGMLFLLLCGAAPAMCEQPSAGNHYDGCNDINSPRRKWIEVDSQILNGLFCVTGFGLIPWRFRDLYWLLRYRFCNEAKHGRAAKMLGLRRLAAYHRGWFRLPGSDTLDELPLSTYVATYSSDASAIDVSPNDALPEHDERFPLPAERVPDDPLTGIRAPPTAVWKLDFVIWCNVWNTFLQACLCGFMWGMNRYNRPSWSTGLFIALACIIAGIGGIMAFKEGKKVKRVEGIPVKTEQVLADVERSLEMEKREEVKGKHKRGLHLGHGHGHDAKDAVVDGSPVA